ncbi:MAG: AAA family ATPase [Polyangiaceae bacterium]
MCGFKSFVDRTVIHFNHDVIGIVGPNGCGKSNIVDSIRWCMGEQSAKHLRGRSMEDVIFNGSESRGPHGFAEVTITFDNTDVEQAAELPEEYKHYPGNRGDASPLSRRNQRVPHQQGAGSVARRDQISFSALVSARRPTQSSNRARLAKSLVPVPKNRRIFIEEAAGITKYKQRRKQAERKIELTRQNLLRITDIVNEIERTRNSLKRQVAKAERYLDYRKEYEDLSLHEASHKYLEFVVTSRVQAELYEENSTKAEELRGKLEALDNGLEDQRQAAIELELETDETAKAAFEADNDVTTQNAQISRSRDKMAHLTDKMAAIEIEQRDVAERMQSLLTEQEEFEKRVSELSRELRAREEDATAEAESLDVLKLEEQRAQEAVQNIRSRVNQASNQAAAASAKLDALEQRHGDLRARRDRIEGEFAKLNEELLDLEARRAALETSVAELAEGKRLSAEEKVALEQLVTELRIATFRERACRRRGEKRARCQTQSSSCPRGFASQARRGRRGRACPSLFWGSLRSRHGGRSARSSVRHATCPGRVARRAAAIRRGK